MSFKPYKTGQAKMSRLGTLMSGLILVFWGGRSLSNALPLLPWGDNWFGKPIETVFGGVREAEAARYDMWFYEGPISPAFLIAGLVVAGGCLWWYWFCNSQKIADMLIEMETELFKVSWPGAADAWQSTLVVTGFTILLVATMVLYDLFIKTTLELFVTAT